MKNDLGPQDFSRFFQELNEVPPFPWQKRLFEVVNSDGWPRTLAVPTGAGKTSVIDIFTFWLALSADVEPADRRAPMRCFFIVDRRVVADEVFSRAQRIARKLEDGRSQVVAEVARRLQRIGGNPPLMTAILRGGIYREDDWARTPVQPLVAVSTVDHFGSRLLFSGYGVSKSSRSIHAGLVGNDALVVLDEVHLSVPFEETLEQVQRYQTWKSGTLPWRWSVVSMSATPRTHGAFGLGEDDRDASCAPALARRLEASKLARLVEAGSSDQRNPVDPLVVKAVEAAKEYVGLGCRAVGVVVNRVSTARAIHTLLREASGFETVLFTGRARPMDRDDLFACHRERIRAGREENPDAQPLVTVATQCIEAGADLDFDALVTECASLDALKQRFGRLDRLGEMGQSCATIIARRESVAKNARADNIYGQALRYTWEWLNSIAPRPERGKRGREKTAIDPTVDFGNSFLPEPDAGTLENLLKPVVHAPVLLPAFLDIWAQTALEKSMEPEPALWLHGMESGAVDASLVWRADVSEQDLVGPVEPLIERVLACPPGSGEVMPVPLAAVRAWLTGLPAGDVADVEGIQDPGDGVSRREGRLVLRWTGETSEVIAASEIRPGDTLLVPASCGGADVWGWNPESTGSVLDLGDRVQREQRGRAVFRLHEAIWRGYGLPAPPSLEALNNPEVEPDDLIDAWLEEIHRNAKAPPWMKKAAEELRRSRRIVPYGSSLECAMLLGPWQSSMREYQRLFTDDDNASMVERQVSLSSHCMGVQDGARRFARLAGLPSQLVEDLALAGWLHDIGKADPRFQLWLSGGDEVAAALSGQLLAKSALAAEEREALRIARERSGYPRGARHEVLSVALLENANSFQKRAHDWDLVRHLVGAHHGHCRPFAPPVNDPLPVQVQIEWGGMLLSASTAHGLASAGSGVAERFWKLVERYGWWGLSWFEAILRLADHRRSESEAAGR